MDTNKAPTWFTVVSILALLWNLVGCGAFGMDMAMSAEDVAQLSPGQQELYATRADWVVLAYAVAVIGGALGSIGLVTRARWAIVPFVLSLLGILILGYGLFVVVDGLKLGGPSTVVTQGLVFVVGVALLLLTRKASTRGWLA